MVPGKAQGGRVAGGRGGVQQMVRPPEADPKGVVGR